MIKAYIQQVHPNAGKMVLQALIPFRNLRESVLFTCKANPNSHYGDDKKVIAKANYDYYQRRIEPSRIASIEKYIRESIISEKLGYSVTALFPSSLILAFNEEDGNTISINKDSCDIALTSNVFIVDGQHRMMAMISLYDKLKRLLLKTPEEEQIIAFLDTYKFNCVLLVNYDLWEQGQVFVNVNFMQKSVNKSLYYEVFGSHYQEDPSKWQQNHIFLAHSLTKYLNVNTSSPFYGNIRMLGTGKGYVSQAFFVEALMRNFRLNGIWSIYRNPLSKDSNVTFMAVELLSYFIAVRNSFNKYWPDRNNHIGTIICKTTGVGAFIRLMKPIRELLSVTVIDGLKNERGVVNQPYCDQVKNILKRVPEALAESLFGENSDYASTSGKGSETKMFNALRNAILLQKTSLLKQNSLGISLDKVSTHILSYLWQNIDSELDSLGHHYEVDDISDMSIDDSMKDEDFLTCKLSFNTAVTIYMDIEDETGIAMSFPTLATVRFLKNKLGKWKLDESSVELHFDTSKYYM